MFVELQVTWWFVPYNKGCNAGSWFGNHIFEIEDDPDQALISWLTKYYAEVLGPQLAGQLDRDLRSPSAETISRVTSIASSRGKPPPPEALAYEIAALEYLEEQMAASSTSEQVNEIPLSRQD